MKLECENVYKSYGSINVLKGADCHIPACKSLMLLGPSGSGKSTLLRMIGGLIVPDQGRIVLNDSPIPTEEPLLRVHRRSIGTVFQSWNLFPHLTAIENISLPLVHVHHLSPKAAKERSFELLARFKLQEQADKRPFELSGGQSQRVAIVRAVAIRPHLLLFDEPTSALDPIMTSEVLDLIAELKRAAATLSWSRTTSASRAKSPTMSSLFKRDASSRPAPLPPFSRAPNPPKPKTFWLKCLSISRQL